MGQEQSHHHQLMDAMIQKDKNEPSQFALHVLLMFSASATTVPSRTKKKLQEQQTIEERIEATKKILYDAKRDTMTLRETYATEIYKLEMQLYKAQVQLSELGGQVDTTYDFWYYLKTIQTTTGNEDIIDEDESILST